MFKNHKNIKKCKRQAIQNLFRKRSGSKFVLTWRLLRELKSLVMLLVANINIIDLDQGIVACKQWHSLSKHQTSINLLSDWLTFAEKIVKKSLLASFSIGFFRRILHLSQKIFWFRRGFLSSFGILNNIKKTYFLVIFTRISSKSNQLRNEFKLTNF